MIHGSGAPFYFATMLSCQRHLFNLPEDLHYLNTAYMGPQLRASTEAGTAALRAKENPNRIKLTDFFEPVEEVKRLFAGLINVADPNAIAIVPAVSYGLSSVAANVRLSAGDRIMTVGDVFPSGYYAFERAARDAGAQMVTVARPAGDDTRTATWNAALAQAIDERTRVVFVPHVHWSCGTVFDLVAVRKRCDEVGALLVVDGTQSVGAHPFDVSEIRPDALAVGGYKWLLGPYSYGYLYLSEALQGGRPLEENWINRLGSENFARLTDYTPDYRPGAARHSVGEQSNFIASAIARVALRQLSEWTVSGIHAYASTLVETNRGSLADLGWVLPKGDALAPHLIGLRLSPKQKTLLPDVLAAAGINVSYRGDYLRVSTHVSTREQDWTMLVKYLELG